MDTDELSNEIYKAIIIEAERFNHDLTLRFGLLAGKCKNEQEYIDNAEALIEYLKKADQEFLSMVFFGIIPELNELFDTLNRISRNIQRVKKIPMNKRHFDF
jgi:hypothetical protein